MFSTDAELTRAVELIKKEDYENARKILMRIDHPLAEQLLQKILMRETARRSNLGGLVVESPVDLDNTLTNVDDPLITLVEGRQLGLIPMVTSSIALFITIVAGFVAGWALYFLPIFLDMPYQLVIYPGIAILVPTLLLTTVMSILRLKNRHIITFLALLLGVLTYASYWAWQYHDFTLYVDQLESETIIEEAAEANRSPADQVIFNQTGETGAIGFVRYYASFGQPVPRGQLIEPLDELGPFMTEDQSLLYWGAELLIMILIPVLLSNGVKNQNTNPILNTARGI